MRVGKILMQKTGGSDVLQFDHAEVGKPGNGEILVRHEAIGLNFIDVYHRTGLYPATLPACPGLEAAGVVEEAGPDVESLKPGDRVAYPVGPIGAYCEARVMPADKVVRVPSGIDARTAAAVMLKGCTAEMLLRRIFPVKAGDVILFHAAAGGVGLIACQWAKALGATVIGTVGNEEKAELAKNCGCDHVVIYEKENFKERVREITDGKGLPVVYDSLGKNTFMDSLECLAPRGMMVTFGNATGPVDPISPASLAQNGSLLLTRPILFHYYASRGDLEAGCNSVFDTVLSGDVTVKIGQTFDLKDAAKAHQQLEQRKTVGSSVLMP